jgi:Sigma-70 region 2
MHSTDPASRRATARQQLVALCQDPWIKDLARRYARDPHLADDALQSACCALLQFKQLDQIENLRAYFCRVIIHEVYRERGQFRATLVEDFGHVLDEHQASANCHGTAPPSFEDMVCTSLQAQSWLRRLVDEGGSLTAAVPARSDDPRRYRMVIYTTAQRILLDGIDGESSEADSNDAFRGAYPEYFDDPYVSPDTRHQRFHRARVDVRTLLQSVVDPKDLPEP